ncbi:MAG: hypothetical protein ACK6DP_14250 [Gemmatimonas sp.]|jgi:phosphoribosyl 1,2-cyclic phosphodiesterase|uniref:hypothetical protein n=1 Tax=Gemmatimonas sp. TaxID=1962908 RepID=UPI00391F375B|nr:hypothetical protein [Gemmatimonadota bacterium]
MRGVRIGDAPPIILDAGTGMQQLGQSRAQTDDDRPPPLFLTHWHSNHGMGLTHSAPLVTSSREIARCGVAREPETLVRFHHHPDRHD